MVVRFSISVPPNFNRPGGVVNATSSPGFGDVRDVILNNPISLYCDTNAVPPPTLTWYKDGQLLASSEKVLILPGDECQKICVYLDYSAPLWQMFVIVCV